MIKTTAYFVFLGLTVLVFCVGELGIHVVKQMDLSRAEFETIFMPLGAASQILFPFFITVLVAFKIRKGSLLLGVICVVIGTASIGLNYEGYHAWEKMFDENKHDQSFQNNFSIQTQYHLLGMVKGIIILGAGAYLVMRHLRKSLAGNR